MTSRVEEIFAGLRREGRKGLIPFVTAGYPSMDATAAAITAFEDAIGPTVVELGIPFSDPIADGAVIAASMHEALKAGTTPQRVFDTVRQIRRETNHALVAMVSASIVERMGPERFVGEAREAGFDGLIVPDLDVSGEPGPLDELTARHEMSFTLLVAPNTPAERLGAIATRCTGFVYVLARLGLTGEQTAMPDVTDRVRAVRAVTDRPIAVGFGISTRGQVEAATEAADAAIVGSAIVRRMGESADSGDPTRAAAAAASLVAQLAANTDMSAGSGRSRPV
ncbi:MAG: tryptophan synthase subunit alpha [Phycisphaerales bacterium]